MRGPRARRAVAAAALVALAACAPTDGTLRVGSKKFTESVVLGELLCELARDAGAHVRHRAELGGTRVLFEGLRAGELDAYVEYSGTLAAELFAGRELAGLDGLRAALGELGIGMGEPLGFDNTYAIGMRRERAAELGIRRISDLARHPDLELGFGEEFLGRADGWPGLRAAYGLPHARVRGLDHDLAYRGLASGALDVMDLYATDAEIAFYDLVALEDDLRFFPSYEALILWSGELAESRPEVLEALRRLEGRLDAARMSALNRAAKIDRTPARRVAREFLARELGLVAEGPVRTDRRRSLGWTTFEHLLLVLPSLLAALLLALPLGIAAARRPRLGQVVLATTGVLQTIPALALLVILIPLLGLGAAPAIAALFLYSLLPIVRNTQAGLAGLPAGLLESADALGLSRNERLRLIELPLALPAILAGVKTAAVINIGTATLGALVGSGGYGQPILTGIRLADTGLILRGAIPAALMALCAQGLFEWAERRLVPAGLRDA